MNINEWIHFSMDDVIECFQWIYKNEPDSIFDEPMLHKLKEWHEKYKMHCDLYVFERCEGFSLDKLQDCYWQELGKESHWLKFAWHAPDAGTDMGNIKVGTNDEKEVLASLERVYDLIISKIGKQAWSDTVRLHLWTASEAVLLSLHKRGVNVLLTADRECVSYHLDEDKLELLKMQGNMWFEPFIYRVTDIRFDWLDEGVSVQELLKKSEKYLKEYFAKPCLEVFVHEWKFEKVVSGIDIYMERFGELRLFLMADAGVMVGRTFYFTTHNTCGLYAMDIVSKEIKLLAALPCKDWNVWKFISLCYYQGIIWMIPWLEDKIITYHLESGKVVSYQLPFLDDDQEPWMGKFRKAVEDGKFLWLLPYATKKIIRIDMEQHSFKTYAEWPSELTFYSCKDVNFLMMCRQGRKLYLLKFSTSHNIIFDMDTGEMEIWGEQLPAAFGIVTENNLIFSPRKNQQPVRVYDMQTVEKNDYFLPDWIWDSKNMNHAHAFWYMRQIGNTVYIFPHDANALLLYDLEKRTIQWIKLDYGVLNTENFNGISDMWEIDGKLFFLSLRNNVLIETDREGNILEHIYLSVPINTLAGMRLNRTEFRKEDDNSNLIDFLSQVINWQSGEWRVG